MRAPAFSFRSKVTFLLSGVVLFLGVIAVVNARQDMRRILGDELERRGEAIARDMAANATDMLLTGDLVGTYDLVNRAKLNNSSVRYILVIGASGDLRVNTFGRGLPPGLLVANELPGGAEVSLRRFATEEGLIRDLAVAVFGGRAGTVRVGMSDRELEAAVAENTRTLVILVAVAVILGLAASYWLSYYLTRPLTRLLEAVGSVARGDLSQRIASPKPDEVGKLGAAFNVMAEELEGKEAARRELMEKVIASQEEERKRVARELHDELAQQLTSVLMTLESVEALVGNGNERAGQRIRRAREVTEGSLAETRRLIGDLRPTVLDDLGLVPAIRSYAESHLRPAGTDAVVTAAEVPEALPPAVDTAVYRIVQEAITNVAKYAGAGRASIALRVSDGALHGEVIDDGQGFDGTTPERAGVVAPSGLGIRGMEERATLLGGSLSVVSAMGRGTRVSFSVPLRQGQDNG